MGQENSDCTAADEFRTQNDARHIPISRRRILEHAHLAASDFGLFEPGGFQQTDARTGEGPDADGSHHAGPEENGAQAVRITAPPVFNFS